MQVIVLEVVLLVALVLKLGWDCVRYRRTGHLPWVARHMCWSLPGTGRVLTRSAPIGQQGTVLTSHWSRSHWAQEWPPRLPRLLSSCPAGAGADPAQLTSSSAGSGEKARVVSKGSSGYITCSAASSNSGAGAGTARAGAGQGLPGGKESSVVRFL